MNKISSYFIIISIVCSYFTVCHADSVTQTDFVTVHSGAKPSLQYALEKNDRELIVTIEVAKIQSTPATLTLGIAGEKQLILSSKTAKQEDHGDITRYVFSIAFEKLQESELNEIRLAIFASWPGGALGKDKRRERYLHVDSGVSHRGLSPSSFDWSTIDLTEHFQLIADRKTQINIELEQPMNGKLTLVLEDEDGKRIRNLLSGVSKKKGMVIANWDGLDDDGVLVKPGKYTWRTAHHSGIKPEFLMQFANGDEDMFSGFGSNHKQFIDATSNSKYAFLAAPMTEGGWPIIAVDEKGSWQKGFYQVHGTPIDGVQIVVDEKTLYAINCGWAWEKGTDYNKPDWVQNHKISLTRHDISSGKITNFSGNKKFIFIDELTYLFGPGAEDERMRKTTSLTGATLFNNKLYLSLLHLDAIVVVDPTSGKVEKRIPLSDPGGLVRFKDRMYAVSGDSIVSFAADGGDVKKILENTNLSIHGLAFDPVGNMYVSYQHSGTVKVFGSNGRLVKKLGIAGGEYQGPYIPERMQKPTGMTIFNNWLWVTENTKSPKRAVAWDLRTDKIIYQKYGNPAYGSPQGGFDPDDHTKWLGLGASWDLDFQTKKATVKSVLRKGGTHLDGHCRAPSRYYFHKQDGRTFLIGLGMITIISELMPDGSVKDLAAIGNLHLFAYLGRWTIPKVLENVLPEKYKKYKALRYKKWETNFLGILWVDKNGDGSLQSEEFDFHDGFQGYSHRWGYNNFDLTLRLPIQAHGDHPKFLTLKPKGFYPGGAPKYPSLSAAAKEAVSWQGEEFKAYKSTLGTTTLDRKGNLIYSASPKMTSVSPEGKVLWQFPNKRAGVHATHSAPLPEVGVMQGTLSFLGSAPLDKQSDVMVLNGYYGRFYALSSDGLYLDEMFKDVRAGNRFEADMIGGEPFGGVFGRSKKDGHFYLQTGSNAYRIYRLNGLDTLQRKKGVIRVSKEQIVAAERNMTRVSIAKKVKKSIVVMPAAKPIKIDAKDNEWDTKNTLSWDKAKKFPVDMKVSYDKDYLYLYYKVRDDSPWVNNGKDWTALFKTGDSVDLQIGTNPKANPNRSKPVEGDMRILIAPYEGKPLAVLYQHRVKGKKSPVTFTSPWRSESVDIVRKLENAKVAVVARNQYYWLEAAIPLADLGLPSLEGMGVKGDFGVVYGDTDGTINLLRNYWSNQVTGLVNDVPGEIMLFPNQWGTVKFK